MRVKMEKMVRNLKLKLFPNLKASGKYSLTLSNNLRLVQFKTSSSYINLQIQSTPVPL